MSMLEPECSVRNCKHYKGIKYLRKSEDSEVPYCSAFPTGIPDDIVAGRNRHMQPIPDQGNDVVFEQGKQFKPL